MPQLRTMEDLESRALRQFDKLVQCGSIIFKDAPPIHVPAQPFNLQFRIASSLTKKPQVDIKEAKAQSDRQQDTPSPFARDPPDFVLEHVGAEHTLRFNKFCVVRPQFVLHTNEYKPQIEPLSASDLAAAWSVLCKLESPYIVIYNGGVQGGWSLPHRHLQLLPRPARDVHDLFPDTYGIENGRVPNIPFQHIARKLSPSPAGNDIFSIYRELLAAAGVDEPDYSHSLVLVREWMMVIPRSRASQEGVKIVNAAGMVGMIWIPSKDVLDIWLQSEDPMEILARFGKPW
ncbi:hypothetical protein CPC735_008370 [Coccidioides posadasii C735 delta SOWgp]|nr:hypothetical protein CPC735_008370 [Coccidioides posadasii C735 delta SOWgp]EER26664.1 hypothetical protein CPC735_008370 [Coccidioides posadasii C735 delta SOWgp]|eukprot:XP_003068809.1 hypothetical protein CPC735_008370 [Coccidioides posadasii C735 delta SOWgp]